MLAAPCLIWFQWLPLISTFPDILVLFRSFFLNLGPIEFNPGPLVFDVRSYTNMITMAVITLVYLFVHRDASVFMKDDNFRNVS